LQNYLREMLGKVEAFKVQLPSARNFVDDLTRALWDTGLHPLQEIEGYGIQPRKTPYVDVYEVLAALANLRTPNRTPDPVRDACPDEYQEIDNYLNFLGAQYAGMKQWLAEAPTDADARAELLRGRLPPGTTQDEQLLLENAKAIVDKTFTIFDDDEMKRAHPKEWEILQLAFVVGIQVHADG
jgi:hypothetical protein